MYCYLGFKLSYLKKPEIVFNLSKRIIWAYSFVKKRQQVLALFISIFLRNQSLSNARWFYSKKRKIGKGDLYLTENRLNWSEMCCASYNWNYMYHTCAKEFFKFELQWSSYWQNINFSRYCPKFHIFTKIVIFQVYLQFLRLTASSL